ncbi:MAG: type II toxin-antitoxin system HicA family toxin [bacterium]|nr:type II toxin-antitoxin system HicA family toxin [bacterium]
MGRIPQISGKDAVKAFEKLGYRAVRQRGSHIRLWPQSGSAGKALTIPDHHIVGKGLLRKLIRDAEISVDEFLNLL